jgi:hypothetical protein
MGKDKKITLKNLPIYLMMFSSLLLIGIADFATAGFELDRFKEASFWFSLFSGVLANFMMLASTALTEIDRIETLDPAVKENANKLQSLVNDTVEEDLDDFIKEENDRRKTKAWKTKTDKLILKLEKKNIFRYWYYYIFKKAYKKRLSLAKQELNNDYITEHLNSFKVKHYKMTKMELISGYKIFDDVEDRITYNKARIILEDNAPTFLLTISLTLFVTSFAFEPKVFAIGLIINFIVKFMLLIWNAYKGFSYAKVFVEKVTVRNQLARIEVFKKYLCWKIKRKNNNNI